MPYTFADLPFFIALPLLLAGSAFFSGCETALFGLTAHQRYQFTQRGGVIGRAVGSLLTNQSLLLVTLMIGNMLINVFYLVVSAMLVLKLEGHGVHPLVTAVISLGPVIGLIIFGDVLPKITASMARMRWVTLTAVPLFALHRVATPFTRLLNIALIRPLHRLFAPATGPKELSTDEMQELLSMSQRRGVIGSDEQRLMGQVLNLSRIKVRDIMVPRVDLLSVDTAEPASEMGKLLQETRLGSIVAYEGDVDHVAGVIYVRQFMLAARRNPEVRLPTLVRNIHFVPEIQRVDQLLEHFRKTGTKLAIAVDEYGGTAGLVSLKNVAERIIGELQVAAGEEEGFQAPQQITPNAWRVSGRLSVRDWQEAFAVEELPPRVTTLGGLVMAKLGRNPKPGDQIHLGNVQIVVEKTDGGRVESILLHVLPTGESALEFRQWLSDESNSSPEQGGRP